MIINFNMDFIARPFHKLLIMYKQKIIYSYPALVFVFLYILKAVYMQKFYIFSVAGTFPLR